MKKFKLLSLLIAMVALPLGMVTSCDKLVYDDMEHCERGVYIHVFSQTECAEAPSYPEWVKELNIYAFDVNDKFVGAMSETDVTLNAEYEALFPLVTPGTYSFVVWAGIDHLFEVSDLVEGVSTKQDLLLKLKKADNKALNLKGQRVYVGTTPNATVGDVTDLYAYTDANIREITNRINVKIEGVTNSSDYDIKILSDNTNYAVNGTIINSAQVEYPTVVEYPTDTEVAAHYNTLKLESGRKSILQVSLKSTGQVLYQEDLVGSILLSPKATNVNLRCENDFDILLKMKKCKDCETGYEVAFIYINNWLVHSYDVLLGE